MIPYWLLTYEEMQALLLDRSDQNAPNQAMLLSREVFSTKEESVSGSEYDGKITLDSPIPYDLNAVLKKLQYLDVERVQGSRGEKDGSLSWKTHPFQSKTQKQIG